MSSDDEPAHSRYSPSTRERWSNCPASIRMQEGYPNETNDAAEQGTRVHDLMHRLLTSKPLPDKVDREELERARYAFGLIRELIDAHLYREDRRVTVYSERKVYLTDNPELRGTLDVAVVVETLSEVEDYRGWWTSEVFVIDYKDGRVPVDVKDNKQLQYYAAAFATLFEEENDVDHTKFYIGIIQPRVFDGIQWDDPKYVPHIWSITRQIQEEVDICETRPFTKAGSWCKYCLAAGACKANAERIMGILGVENV